MAARFPRWLRFNVGSVDQRHVHSRRQQFSRAAQQIEGLEGRLLLSGLSWTSGPALPSALGNMAALDTALGVLVVGGATNASGSTTPRSAHFLDPATNSWSTTPNIDQGRNAGGIGATGNFGPIGSDGYIYASDIFLFGGANQGQVTATTFNYDLYNTEDSDAPPAMSVARYLFAYATDPACGDLYAMGGLSASHQALASVERYDPATDSWSTMAALPQALYGASAAADGAGHILVFGGDNSAGTPVSAVYRYTIATNSWTMEAAMPMAASGTAAVFGAYGQIYVIGGLTASGPVANVNIYNPVTNQWASDTPLPTAEYATAATIDSVGNLDVFGGFNSAGNAVATVYESAALPAPAGLPAVPTVQLLTGGFVYDATPHAADALALAADGVTPVDGTFAFTYDGSSTPPTNVGTYNVVATFTSTDPNYVSTVTVDTLYIDPATPTLNISGGGTILYDGLSHGITATAVGVDGTTAVNGVYSFSYNGVSTAPIDPGTYAVVVNFTSSDANYTDASGSTTIIIPDPTIPTGVTVAGASTSSVQVSWNPVAGAAYYNVYQRHVLHSPKGSGSTIYYSVVAGHLTDNSATVNVTGGTFAVTSVSDTGVESPRSALASGSALSSPYLANFLLGGAVVSWASVQVGHTLQITLLGYGNEAPDLCAGERAGDNNGRSENGRRHIYPRFQRSWHGVRHVYGDQQRGLEHRNLCLSSGTFTGARRLEPGWSYRCQ